ncbi:uncharacterized protein [Penaeus vannamei]|uniref:uncharacterized protein n=1 Tax=Penaeus vannamei TaxID=6689 RepID=UPI00387FA6A3
MSEQVATGEGAGGAWGVNAAALHGACTPAHHPLYTETAHVNTGGVTCNAVSAQCPAVTYSVPPPPLCPHAPSPDAYPACALCAARDHPPPTLHHHGPPVPPASAEEARTLALQLRAAAILNKSELAVPVATFHLSVPPPRTPTAALALPPPAFPYPPPTPTSTSYEDAVGVHAACESAPFSVHGGGPGSPSCPFHPPPTPTPALTTACSTSPLPAPASPCPSISSTCASTMALASATASTNSIPDGILDAPSSSSSVFR